jgi:SanA protein
VLVFAVLSGSAVLLVVAANVVVLLAGRGRAPERAEAALVLGAQVLPDGRLSAMLDDRVRVAAGLYRSGRVRKLLLSGDHGRPGYDEVNAMRRRALALGVPPQDVFTDHAGFDTWQSATRARRVFGVHDALVVTQGFHLPRAVWLARRAGLRAGGVAADRPGGYGAPGRATEWRETLARVKAVVSAVLRPDPRFLGPVIPIGGDGRASWDVNGS